MVRWPFAVAVGAPLCFGLIQSCIPDYGLLKLVLLLVTRLGVPLYLLTGVGLVGGAGSFAWHRRWRAAVSCAAMPLLIAGFFLRPVLLTSILSVADYVDFVTIYDRYRSQVDAQSGGTEPRFIPFFWRDASGTFGETLQYPVFDESDEIALPDEGRTPAWPARVARIWSGERDFVPGSDIRDHPHHLFGHDYVVYIDL